MLEGQTSKQAVPIRIWSEQQRAAVSQEMARILSHSTFKTSNRCTDLLRYVVKCAKAGVEVDIKERTLGIEVFERESNYDVGADPIVRRVASEVRKRLAQYYQEEPDDHAVKIHLLRGGYLPEFEFLPDKRAEIPSVTSSTNSSVIEPTNSAPRLSDRSSAIIGRVLSARWVLAITTVILIAAIVLIWYSNVFISPIQRVWKPLLETDGTILVCLPDDTQFHNSKRSPVGLEGVEPPKLSSTLFRDLRAGNSVTMLLARLNKHAELVSSSAIQYPDFQHGPVILIGGVNNPWVQAFLSKLRYTVHFDPVTREAWVQDAFAPSSRKWKTDSPRGDAPPPEDYAVFTRTFNEETGQWIVALSGLTFNSTQATGELVTNPKIAQKIPLRVRGQGNFQIVLRMSLMGNEPGPIQVIDVHTW